MLTPTSERECVYVRNKFTSFYYSITNRKSAEALNNIRIIGNKMDESDQSIKFIVTTSKKVRKQKGNHFRPLSTGNFCETTILLVKSANVKRKKENLDPNSTENENKSIRIENIMHDP